MLRRVRGTADENDAAVRYRHRLGPYQYPFLYRHQQVHRHELLCLLLGYFVQLL